MTGSNPFKPDNLDQWQELLPHAAREMVCDHCEHEWVAVYAVGVSQLQCPHCAGWTDTQEGRK